MSDANHLWSACADLLRAQVSDPVWHTAFEGVRAVDYDGQLLTLGVASPLAKERIEGRYLSLVRDALVEAGAAHAHVRVRIEPPPPPPLWPVPVPSALSVTSRVDGQPEARDGAHLAEMPRLRADTSGDVELNPRYTFENFVIGGSNSFAHAAALSVAETPARKFNPLFIYGHAGLGKTHLLQAIASYVSHNYPAYRMRSRFQQGLMTDIQPPALETRMAILRKKADLESPTRIPNDVLELIATNIKDNIRVLEGALIRVSAFASLTHEPLTVERATQVLADLLSENQPRPITPQLILDETAKQFGFTIDDTTVIHAVEKIGTLMSKDRQIYDQVTRLMRAVRQGD